MTRCCPVCGDARIRNVAPYRHTNVLFAGRSRTVCDGCGMVFASPMPDEAALAAYNASYFDSAHGGAPHDPVATAFHSAINLLRVVHLEQYLGARKLTVSTILEVGPGGGHFARHWLARHRDTVYHAIESDASCHPTLRALGITLQTSPQTFGADFSLDAVMLSHVLEHTADPVEFLRAMTARLRTGGVVFIEVPCRDWEHKARDEPHLLFFDKAPMERLLKRLGFGEIQLTYHGREIARLRSHSLAGRMVRALRGRLLACGVVAPFSRITPGLEVVVDPLERAAVALFEAHLIKDHPAWWLRAAARKR